METLKQMGMQIGEELDEQNRVLDRVNGQLGSNQEKMQCVEGKMKKILK